MTTSEIEKLNSLNEAISESRFRLYTELLNLERMHATLDLISGYRLEYGASEDPMTEAILFFADALAASIEKLNRASEEIEVQLFHCNWPQYAAQDDRQQDDR